MDAERVEVIKGPASMLFGRGDPGGVVNIVTRRPTLDPTADASLQGGSFGFRRFQGSASSALPAVEGLAARLSFAAQEDPTFRTFGGDTFSRRNSDAFSGCRHAVRRCMRCGPRPARLATRPRITLRA